MVRLPWKDPLSVKLKVLVTQSCPTPCDAMDFSLPGSSVRGIFQARILEWFAISFSRGSSQPRNWTCVPGTAGRFFTNWATTEAQRSLKSTCIPWMDFPSTSPKIPIFLSLEPSTASIIQHQIEPWFGLREQEEAKKTPLTTRITHPQQDAHPERCVGPGLQPVKATVATLEQVFHTDIQSFTSFLPMCLPLFIITASGFSSPCLFFKCVCVSVCPLSFSVCPAGLPSWCLACVSLYVLVTPLCVCICISLCLCMRLFLCVNVSLCIRFSGWRCLPSTLSWLISHMLTAHNCEPHSVLFFPHSLKGSPGCRVRSNSLAWLTRPSATCPHQVCPPHILHHHTDATIWLSKCIFSKVHFPSFPQKFILKELSRKKGKGVNFSR